MMKNNNTINDSMNALVERINAENIESANTKKISSFEIILFEDDGEDKQKEITRYIDVCKSHEFSYCYIKHDSDFYTEDTFDKMKHLIGTKGQKKKNHYHFDVLMPYPISISDLSIWFGVPQNMIQNIKPKNIDSALVYLTHISHPEKHQYSVDDLKGNIVPYVRYLNENYIKYDVINYVIEEIDKTDKCISYKYLVTKFLMHNGQQNQLQKYYNIIKSLVDEHNRNIDISNEISNKVDRNTIKLCGQIKKQNDAICKLTDVFDKVDVEDLDGNTHILMKIGDKKK